MYQMPAHHLMKNNIQCTLSGGGKYFDGWVREMPYLFVGLSSTHLSSLLSEFQAGTLQKRRSHLFSDPRAEMLIQNGPTQTTILDTQVGVGDFVLLDPLTEEAFIENLKKRFASDNIYVSTWLIV